MQTVFKSLIQLFTLASLLIVALPTTQAQFSVPNESFVEPLNITAEPQTPEPNEPVTLSVESFTLDLSRANIAWTVDGQIVREGRGETEHTLTAGPVGSAMTITVLVSPADSERVVEEQVTIRPARLSIIWEARGYTPPFYPGRTVPVRGGDVFIHAQTDFRTGSTRLASDEIVFTWRINNSVRQDLSGPGRDRAVITLSDIQQNVLVSITAESLSGALSAKETLFIPAAQPQVVLYELHPTRGVLYNRALTRGLTLRDREVSIVAEPFYFSQEVRDTSELEFNWQIDGAAVTDTSARSGILNLRAERDTLESIGTLQLRNPMHVLQAARAAFRIRADF